MNTQKRVFNKLFKEEKTELATQKIELKSLSQIKENIKIANSLIKLAEKEGDIFAQKEADLERAYSKFIKVRNDLNYHANRIIPMDNNELLKKAKELGLNVNDIPEIKQAEKLGDKLKEYVKLYDGVKKYKAQV